jgi:drug/metabolite transporter (DMT)-like permease
MDPHTQPGITVLTSFPLLGETCAVLSALTWAIATVLFTTASRQLRPEAANLFKTTLASVLLVLTLLALKGRAAFQLPDQTEALYLVASGLLGIAISDTLYFWCLREIGAWRTLVISCLAPPVTVLLSALVLRDPMRAVEIIGMIVALAGVILAVIGGRRRREDGLSFTRSGLAVGITSSVAISIAIILTKVGTAKTGALEASTIRIVVAVPGILLIQMLRPGFRSSVRSALNPPGKVRLISASLIGTYVAYLLFIAGIKYAHAGVATALAATSPAFVIPLSAVFLKERITLLAVIGTTLAVAGIAILFML